MFQNVTFTHIKIILYLINTCFFHSVQEGFTKSDYLYTIYFYMHYKKFNHTNSYYWKWINNTHRIDEKDQWSCQDLQGYVPT